jgi:hypothetical protein
LYKINFFIGIYSNYHLILSIIYDYTTFESNTRDKADFGWLKANFSFSLGNYYNPERLQFDMLYVLNDDTIAGGTGFATHPHANVEIIIIPLEGGLKHCDSMGNEGGNSFWRSASDECRNRSRTF